MVIFDERFPESRGFARAVAGFGVSVRGIRGDITDVWYQDLYPRWQQNPVAIAGLTAHGPVFCLERLAWDVGMRVVYRGDHRHIANGLIEHAVEGPPSMVQNALRLADQQTDWGARAADLIARCPVDLSGPPDTASLSCAVSSAGDDFEPLVSWVIAPIRRVRVTPA